MGKKLGKSVSRQGFFTTVLSGMFNHKAECREEVKQNENAEKPIVRK